MAEKIGSYRLLAKRINNQVTQLLSKREDINALTDEELLQLEDAITMLLCNQILCLYGVGSRVCLKEAFFEEHKDEYEEYRGKGATVIDIDERDRKLKWDDESLDTLLWANQHQLDIFID